MKAMKCFLPFRSAGQRCMRCFCVTRMSGSGRQKVVPQGRPFRTVLSSEFLSISLLLASVVPAMACSAQLSKQAGGRHTAVPLAPGESRAPAPVERREPSGPPPASAAFSAAPPNSPSNQRAQPANARVGRSVPLAEWMTQHSRLSPTDQQHALEREPGFRDLPQPTQERMRQRLSELDSMPPARRQRILARNEAMEHLSPDQRFQVRGAMQQLGALPQDQRRFVARTFRELRDLPPDQREAALSSERYRGLFNGTQRSTLSNLLRIEPMLPPPDRTPQ